MTEGFVVTNETELTKEILHLISEAKLDEEFRTDAKYKFLGKKDGKIVGLVAYTLEKFGDKIQPRFVHVIIHPHFKRKRVIVKLLKDTEAALLKDGYNQTVAYIRQEKAHMAILAMKFGFKIYKQGDKGNYYYKNLGGKKC